MNTDVRTQYMSYCSKLLKDLSKDGINKEFLKSVEKTYYNSKSMFENFEKQFKEQKKMVKMIEVK
jgi:hypothetical protein